MFVDRAIITVKAGDGGGGAIAWRREKYDPKGGPHGGDGGNGGAVVLQADDGLNTLYDFRGVPLWAAEDGEAGGGKQCHGANAPDLIIRVPAGTLAYDGDTAELLADIAPGGRVVIAKGGRGGFGNEHFKSSTNQAPRTATPGEPGETRHLRLELKLIADVGFVGLPNAGKSTLLAALTRAHPKIGNYPFTTLAPQLGIAEVGPQRRIVLADIPGLIEGASHGAGLGHDFLRHIERTRVILHLIDASPLDDTTPAQNYRVIRHELSAYSTELADKPELVALNKVDLLFDDAARADAVRELAAEVGGVAGKNVIAISGASHENLTDLLEKLWSMLHPQGGEQPGWNATSAEV